MSRRSVSSLNLPFLLAEIPSLMTPKARAKAFLKRLCCISVNDYYNGTHSGALILIAIFHCGSDVYRHRVISTKWRAPFFLV